MRLVKARDGARGPVDLGFARTEAKRRKSNFEARLCLNSKKDIHSDVLFAI